MNYDINTAEDAAECYKEYDGWQYADREAIWKWMFERGLEVGQQQLAAKNAEIARLNTVPMRYRRMAFNAQLQNENEQLCQQLAKAKDDADEFEQVAANHINECERLRKQNVFLRNLIATLHKSGVMGFDINGMRLCAEAIDATQDLSGCILCDAEPVGEVQHMNELNDEWISALPIGTPLYKARKP